MSDLIKALLIGTALVIGFITIPIIIAVLIPVLLFVLVVVVIWFLLRIAKQEDDT